MSSLAKRRRSAPKSMSGEVGLKVSIGDPQQSAEAVGGEIT